jgi:hypothetical protein
MTGYHINDILKWETGKSTPALRRLIDWAQALGFRLVLEDANKQSTIFDMRASDVNRRATQRSGFVDDGGGIEAAKPLPRNLITVRPKAQRDLSELRPPTDDEVMAATIREIERAAR